MIIFILGLVIGSIGGMIMMAMFMTGKTRDSSLSEGFRRQGAGCPPDTVTSSAVKKGAEKRRS